MTGLWIARRVAAHVPNTITSEGLRRAAVLVLMRDHGAMGGARGGARGDPAANPAAPAGAPVPEGTELDVVLTRRSAKMPSHAGQVSFPGGGLELHDADAEAGALREAEEEIGVPAALVTVVGRLDDLVTPSGYHITPVVGFCSPEVVLRPDVREVERVLAVPLRDLMDPGKWVQKSHALRGQRVLLWHFPFAGEDIWGATAIVLRTFLSLIADAP